MDSIPDDVEQIIRYIAGNIARQFPPVERDDAQQELRLYWLTTPSAQNLYTKKLTEMHLYNVAKDWALKERAEWLGKSVHYYYTPDDVRSVLKVLFQYPRQDWESAYCPDDAKTQGRWSDGLEVMFDAVLAFDYLEPDHQEILAYANATDRVDALSNTERSQHSRAVHRLSVIMNDKKHARAKDAQFSSRRSLTNAAARAAIGDQN